MKKPVFIIAVLLFTLLAGCTTDTPNIEEVSKAAEASPVFGTGATDDRVNPLSDFEYKEEEDGSITITRYRGTDRHVVIPGEIEEKPVTKIGWYAFAGNASMVSVKIPESVTVISTSAFEECSSLSEVSLPQGLQSMESAVFNKCVRLSTVTLPEQLTRISSMAFAHCILLKHIYIPKNVTKIDDSAFYCSGLETVDFEEGLEIIGGGAFAYTKLETVILPKSVREVSIKAFFTCEKLESITLGDELTTVGYQALGGPSRLTEIAIPASVAEIDEMAFAGCDSLQAVRFEGNAPGKYQLEKEQKELALAYTSFPDYTVYYHALATGFTSPQWCGYQTAIW